jgi:predicted transcriptional regulator
LAGSTPLHAAASMSETIIIKLEDKAQQALHRLAELTERSADDLVNQAILDYLQLQEWQRQKIETGIAAAERCEFATKEELTRIFNKYSML